GLRQLDEISLVRLYDRAGLHQELSESPAEGRGDLAVRQIEPRGLRSRLVRLHVSLRGGGAGFGLLQLALRRGAGRRGAAVALRDIASIRGNGAGTGEIGLCLANSGLE